MPDRHLLTDLRLELADARLRPVYRVAESSRRVPERPARLTDLATVGGRDNLAQAVLLRLLTPRGELAPLGHPDYGSRLHELVGAPNTATQRSLVKLHVLESLAREPRIAEVEEVRVEPVAGTRDRVRVEIAVVPAAAAGSVTIGPFTLELGA